jgi:hypothetical protein
MQTGKSYSTLMLLAALNCYPLLLQLRYLATQALRVVLLAPAPAARYQHWAAIQNLRPFESIYWISLTTKLQPQSPQKELQILAE